MSYGADTQSVVFSREAGLGRVIFNVDHNNGLTCITAPRGIGTKRKLCARARMRGWGKAESSASRDGFAASTLCNFTLTACTSQARYFFNL